jgi:hypothetical protein
MTTLLTHNLALTIARRLCAARGCDLALSTDPRRRAVVAALTAVHALTGSEWDADHARDGVTVTLPGIGPALTMLLGAIPYVGGVLSAVAHQQAQTTIYLSPGAEDSATALLATIAHELGHVDQIARGGLVWCAAYGLVGEVRAGAESPCYGQDVAVEHALENPTAGAMARDLTAQCLRSLAGYGLDADGLALARGVLGVVARTLDEGGELPGPCQDVIRELRAEGVL